MKPRNIENTQETVLRIISALTNDKETASIITAESNLENDLCLDSLKMLEMCVAIENVFRISIEKKLGNIKTVRDIVALIESNVAISDIQYNIEDYPLVKTEKHIRRLKLFMRLSRLAWRFDVTGLENLPADGRYILCPNHQSYLDCLWVWTAIGHKRVALTKISCLAAEVFLPSEFMLAMLGGIPVERSGNTIPAMKRALACLQGGYAMLIHPEGTRTRDGKMQAFKGGAAKLAIDAGVPLIPVRIDGAWDIFPPHRKRPKAFRFGRRYPIKISFGAPIKPDGKSVEELTAQLQGEVARMEHTG